MTEGGATGSTPEAAPGRGSGGASDFAVERLIVAGPSAILRPLIESFDQDPAATVIDVSPGGHADPERVVVTLPADRAAALTAALGTALVIERDLPLHPLDEVASPQVPPPPPPPHQ